MLQLLMWVTPAGTVDDGGLAQPAYLNFDISLLGPPSGNVMEVCSPCSPSAEPLCCAPLVPLSGAAFWQYPASVSPCCSGPAGSFTPSARHAAGWLATP